jgi:hypothetical protein
MTYAPAAIAPRGSDFTTRVRAKSGLLHGLLRRMVEAFLASRRRQAEREVVRYLAGTGGKFTDEAEREIERRFLSNPSGW